MNIKIELIYLIQKDKDNSFSKFFKPELTNDISTNKTDKIEKNVFPKKRSKRNSFAITLNKEKNLFNIKNDKNKKSFKHYNTKNTFNFPSLPNQKLTMSIQMLDKHKTFFTVNIKMLECIAHDALVNIRKLWRKKIVEFVNFFESKKKII